MNLNWITVYRCLVESKNPLKTDRKADRQIDRQNSRMKGEPASSLGFFGCGCFCARLFAFTARPRIRYLAEQQPRSAVASLPDSPWPTGPSVQTAGRSGAPPSRLTVEDSPGQFLGGRLFRQRSKTFRRDQPQKVWV